MVTEVIMKRELFGEQISQKTKSEFFSATDLVRAGNFYRSSKRLGLFNMSAYLNTNSFKEFRDVMEAKYGEVIVMGRGKGSHTWVHPLIFIDMALEISPDLKVEVYEWIFDNLIKYRNESGDSYKEMCASLFSLYNNHREFPRYISQVADQIKLSCGVKDWQTATQQQLDMRDKIHNAVKLLCNVLKDYKQAVRIGISEVTQKQLQK